MTRTFPFIKFVKINRSWTAQIYSDDRTCISWVKLGSMRNVRKAIREECEPVGIQTLIVTEEEVSDDL
tara:strand:+ start:290 stop:493 length:204 start_codon:yes stop_codon:yes gene_type:complete